MTDEFNKNPYGDPTAPQPDADASPASTSQSDASEAQQMNGAQEGVSVSQTADALQDGARPTQQEGDAPEQEGGTANATGTDTNPYGDPNAPENPYYPRKDDPNRAGEGYSIASLVLGILSLVCCCGCFGFIPGILAIVFAGMDRSRRRMMNGYDIGGIVTGILGILVSIFTIFFVVLFAVINGTTTV